MLSKAEIRRYNRNSAMGNETVYYLRFIPFCSSCISGFTKEKKDTPKKCWVRYIGDVIIPGNSRMLQRLLHPENYRGSFSSSKHRKSCYIVVRQLQELTVPLKSASLSIGGENRLKPEWEFPLLMGKERCRGRAELKQSSPLSRG